MSFKLPLTLALALLAAAHPHAQEGRQPPQDDQKVIEDFVNTRGVVFERPGRKKPTPKQQAPQARPGRKGAASAASKKGKGARPAAADKTTTAAGAASPQTPAGADESAAFKNTSATAAAAPGPPKPIGLGYTLFMSDEDANAVVVDAAREFKAGDQIRLLLETNTDGFLYIFHTEDGRSPQMLFPHAALERGRNNVAAHSREFFPADPSYGFVFDERPAAERLYVVVSRKALAGVPVGEELLKFCGGEREDCYWKPSAPEWERIKAGGGGARSVEAKNWQLAGRRTAAPAAGTRGVRLKKGEPAPAVVRMGDRPETDVLVTTIDLVHK